MNGIKKGFTVHFVRRKTVDKRKAERYLYPAF
jgi:hypothetical protein